MLAICADELLTLAMLIPSPSNSKSTVSTLEKQSIVNKSAFRATTPIRGNALSPSPNQRQRPWRDRLISKILLLRHQQNKTHNNRSDSSSIENSATTSSNSLHSALTSTMQNHPINISGDEDEGGYSARLLISVFADTTLSSSDLGEHGCRQRLVYSELSLGPVAVLSTSSLYLV